VSVCRTCNAPIVWVLDEHGAKVPLDDHEQRDYGPARYRILRDGARPLVVAVAPESTARAYVDHRSICGAPRAI
jgi:hypothetical protein